MNKLQKKIIKKSRKARKIISVIEQFKELKNSKILDIGSGTGVISNVLSKYSKDVYGVDTFDYRVKKKTYKFKKVKDEIIPFKEDFFDVIVSNQVIEHVQDQEKHLREIFRTLKKDGICYLATPNKYFPIEPHYSLPFLGMLPKKIADFYLQVFKNKDYDVYLLSFNQLKNKIRKYFRMNNFTKKIMINPKKYYLEEKFQVIPKEIIQLIPSSLLNNLSPGFIVVLKKKN
ncbi:hypothetical protein CL617_03495 [archaeon]|jgi:2-polyprenyl-3-methyl-5-hydroxy-6-metoxy-1,4-benzoquinol methylase|nr:hypothetical protein [archaeon]|tara:strand:+ start:3559 stop:4248 length:690 start_codon:yes stop_codon:yes gene_type:complete